MMPLGLKSAFASLPGVGWVRRWRLLRRFKKINQPWDAAYLDPELGVLRFSGSWREIGYKIGLVGGVREVVPEILGLLDGLDEQTRDQVQLDAERSSEHTAKYLPQLEDLLAGMSDSAEIPVARLLLAQFITAVGLPFESRSCGAIGWMTPDGPILGQALDLGLTNNTATALLEPDEGLSFLAHMNIGTLWFSTGINSRGVIIGGASVNGRRDAGFRAPCFPHTFINLLVLSKASSASEALELVQSAAPYGGPGDASCHLLADSHKMLVVEVVGARVAWERRKRAVVNNHFTLDDMLNLEASDPASLRLRRLSQARQASAQDFLQTIKGEDQASLAAFLGRGSTCSDWFRSAIPPDEGWTTARHLIDVGAGKFISWHGVYPGHSTPISVPLDCVFRR